MNHDEYNQWTNSIEKINKIYCELLFECDSEESEELQREECIYLNHLQIAFYGLKNLSVKILKELKEESK